VALLAFAKTSGVVLRWFRDGFAPGASYEELFCEAAAVPPGAEGLTALPHFSGTATPDFNPAARGAFSGLSLAHGRAHLFRALVESLSFTVRENAELLGRAVKLTGLRAIGGGARSDVWLGMIADVTGLVVERPRFREAACLGAAELAMCAAGRFGSVADASRTLYAAERRFEPDAAWHGAYDEAYARYRRLRAETYGNGMEKK
jgi:xylulokinase